MNKKISRFLTKLDNFLYEYKLGIATRGIYHGMSVPGYFYYSTCNYRMIFNILNYLSLKSTDVFVDIGCGRGRVVCCAALFEVKEVIGIDFDDALCETAKLNAMRLRGKKSPISILNIKAQDFNYENHCCPN